MGIEGLFHSHDACDSSHDEDNGNPMQGDPRFRALLEEMWELHCKKGNDYGKGKDFLANLRASTRFGIPAYVGALIRLNDKLIRLENVAQGTELANESAHDSFIDLACYALLADILYMEYVQ